MVVTLIFSQQTLVVKLMNLRCFKAIYGKTVIKSMYAVKEAPALALYFTFAVVYIQHKSLIFRRENRNGYKSSRSL